MDALQGETEDVANQLMGQEEGRLEESCLLNFNNFLGLPTECCEGEILDLLKRISVIKFKGKGVQGTIEFDRELKKLEWIVTEKGRSRSGLSAKGERGCMQVNK